MPGLPKGLFVSLTTKILPSFSVVQNIEGHNVSLELTAEELDELEAIASEETCPAAGKTFP
jgi:hypothetical protein